MLNTSVPVTLFSNFSTFRDSNKPFKLDGDLLKTMTNYKFNVDRSNLQDRKKFRELAEQMNSDFSNIYSNVIYCRRRKNNYKNSYSWYTRMSINTHINVCIHK